MKQLSLCILFLTSTFLFGCSSTQTLSTPQPTAKDTNKSLTVEYQCKPEATAFTLLQDNYPVEFQDTSFGKLITSIDGQPQSDGKYWLFTVDEKEATIGAEAYHCVGNENIRWELR